MQVDPMSSESSNPAAVSAIEKGVAGRINYAAWDKVASDLVEQVEQEDEAEIADQKAKVGRVVHHRRCIRCRRRRCGRLLFFHRKIWALHGKCIGSNKNALFYS